MRMSLFAAIVVGLAAMIVSPRAAPVRLIAAGSLKAALGDIVKAYTARTGVAVEMLFGASGLMREKIEAGTVADIFASANMGHPETLAAAGKAGPVVRFAYNKLCALTQPDIDVSSETLLARMLAPDIRLGTSTPKADPAGDYAFQLFDKADDVRPGATRALEEKSLQLTGGPTSPKAPAGRNQYGWIMSERRADIFLTYCTNAVLAQRDTPGLRIVVLPDALSVGATYGLTVMNGAPEIAWQLAAFITFADGQAILARHGFAAPAVPAK